METSNDETIAAAPQQQQQAQNNPRRRFLSRLLPCLKGNEKQHIAMNGRVAPRSDSEVSILKASTYGLERPSDPDS